jgi:hypothetical protein
MYTGYLLSDGVTDLSNVFMNINEAGLISANKFQQKMTCLGNIDLSGSFLYGRNDGYTFDTSLNSLIPVGYTLDISNVIATGTNDTTYSISTPIYNGTWIVNYGVECKGSNNTTASNYATNAKIFYDLSGNSNIIYTHQNTKPGYLCPIQSTINANLLVSPMSIVTTAKVLNTTILETNASLTGGISNNIYLKQTLSITKIG